MNNLRRAYIILIIIFLSGLLPAIICQLFRNIPSSKKIHITSFRYGKSPSVIRCNRGDTLHLTFSTDDTGHSFFLEEFDIDVKVTPSSNEVAVFSTSDPGSPSATVRELTLIAKHPGLLNYVVARSSYRCHVWCGPMHAFEQGKLIILPNTLLVFSLGSLSGIIGIWLIFLFHSNESENKDKNKISKGLDILSNSRYLKRVLLSRWPQIVITIVTLLFIYIVILTSLFGTKVSGRNLGVLLMWIVWLFLLIAILTPFFGRIWCTICPLPFFGDLIQRKSYLLPQIGKTKDLNNKYSGLFLKWPERLNNDWLKLFVFLTLATFSTTMVAVPKISGMTVVILLFLPVVISLIFELRAFCRYICPVSVFVNPFSRVSPLSLRNKSQEVCDQCRPHFCQKGNTNGWACPYGLNVKNIRENTDCGLCLECIRTCTYENISIYRRPFASEIGTRSLSEAWITIAVFTIAFIYSILYLGNWPAVRDYVNIIDKENWNLFGIYTIILWFLVLILVPGIIWGVSYAGKKLTRTELPVRKIFLKNSGSLLPLGLFMWIAFVVPMLFVNVTFIKQSFSDPFGWGWDFFGTANTPWHQFIPQYIPWIQTVLILTGCWFSLRNLGNTWKEIQLKGGKTTGLAIPMAIIILFSSVLMLLFFTN